MVRPHPVLFDLAAARTPGAVDVREADGVVGSAVDHRMTGLLWSAIAARRIELPGDHEHRLAARDAAVELHQGRIWAAMRTIQERLEAVGIGVAYFKGMVVATRWYGRPAERPCRDIDLLLEPGARARIDDVLGALQPTHPYLRLVPDLVRTGILQSVDLMVDGLAVDVHLDLLKFEVPTRQADRIWARVTRLPAPGGGTLPAIDPEVSLVHVLLHANKDRFARLIAYADVARAVRGEVGLDWAFIDDFVRAEGLRIPVHSSLSAVTSALSLPSIVTPPIGVRARAWRVLWPPDSHLQGTLGLMTRQHHQFLLPLLAEGRFLEGVRWLARRRLVPPGPALDMYYPDARGPYLARVTVGRLRRALARRHAARLYQ